MSNYNKEIIDYQMHRLLQTDIVPAECDLCEETSVFVELHDTTYRNYGTEQIHLVPLCIHCYYHAVVIPMDDLWTDYYAAIL